LQYISETKQRNFGRPLNGRKPDSGLMGKHQSIAVLNECGIFKDSISQFGCQVNGCCYEQYKPDL